jgi:hypothetical protein
MFMRKSEEPRRSLPPADPSTRVRRPQKVRKQTVARLVGINLGLLFGVLIAFEIAAWLLVPDQVRARLWPYGCLDCEALQTLSPGHQLPQGYFQEDAERGFAIVPSAAPVDHWVDGVYYPIWSNRLGCFDREPPAPLGDYVYLGGDSSAWGYAPFEAKFGTLLEREIGVPVLKCGVVHTGQRHQLDKMREVVAAVGKPPAMIVVTYEANDIDNDFAFPHSTVIDGWIVDDKLVWRQPEGRYEITRVNEEELRKTLADYLDRYAAPPSWFERVSFEVRKYSATANIAKALTERLSKIMHGDDVNNYPGVYKNMCCGDGRFSYTENPFAQPNKEAILEIRDFARAQGAALLMVLMPQKFEHDNIDYFVELKAFLATNDIFYLDPTADFARHARHEVFWPKDWHVNERGNALLADLMAEEVKTILADRTEGENGNVAEHSR